LGQDRKKTGEREEEGKGGDDLTFWSKMTAMALLSNVQVKWHP